MIQSDSIRFKYKFTNDAGNDETVNGEIAVPLKYLNNSRITFDLLLINFKITLDLTWSANCVIYEANRVTAFEVTDNHFTNWNQILKEQVTYRLKELSIKRINTKIKPISRLLNLFMF